MKKLFIGFIALVSISGFAAEHDWERNNGAVESKQLEIACERLFRANSGGLTSQYCSFEEIETACFGTILYDYNRDGIKAQYIEVYAGERLKEKLSFGKSGSIYISASRLIISETYQFRIMTGKSKRTYKILATEELYKRKNGKFNYLNPTEFIKKYSTYKDYEFAYHDPGEHTRYEYPLI